MDLRTDRAARVLATLFLLGSVLFVYGRLRTAEFLSLDDRQYLVENPHLEDGLSRRGIVWAFRADLADPSPHADYWRPVSFLSHMLDRELFGAAPGGPHLGNVILHLMNALLVFYFFERHAGSPWRCVFLAGVFALHPLQVEAVAWVSARKDVLGGFFTLTAMVAYGRIARAPSRAGWAAVGVLHLLAVLTKPMYATLPLLLLLLDEWPLRRVEPVRTRLREKIPLFVVSVLSFAATAISLPPGSHAGPLDGPIASKLVSSALLPWIYLFRIAWPAELALQYPPLETSRWAGPAVLLGLGGACAIGALLRPALRATPFRFGGLWFAVSLLPVIFLTETAGADRFTYLPILGVAAALAWIEADGRIRAALGAFLLAASIFLSRAQAELWTDRESLYRHVLEVTGENWAISDCYGMLLLDEGRYEEAIARFGDAIRARPSEPGPHNNLGIALFREKRYSEALDAFTRARANAPAPAQTEVHIGAALREMGRIEESLRHFRAAAAFDGGLADAHRGAAYSLADLAETDLAAGDSQVRAAGARRATRALAHCARFWNREAPTQKDLVLVGRCLALAGRLPEAEALFQRALRTDPEDGEARRWLARVRRIRNARTDPAAAR